MTRRQNSDSVTTWQFIMLTMVLFCQLAPDAFANESNALQNVTGDLTWIGYEPEVREYVIGSETYVLCNIEGRLYSIRLDDGTKIELTAGLENPAVQRYSNSHPFTHESSGISGRRWLASGSHVYFISNNSLYRVALSGGPLITLATSTSDFRISGNGTTIVYLSGSSLFAIPSAGGSAILVVPSSSYSQVGNYAFTPNGQRVLFTAFPAGSNSHETGLFSVSASGGSIVRLNSPVGLALGNIRRILAYWINPSSTRVIFQSNEILTDGHCIHSAPLNAANQSVAVEKRATNRMALSGNTPQLVFTPDGSRIAYILPIDDGVTSGYGLFTAPVGGGTVVRHNSADQISFIPPHDTDGNRLSFSNDGLKLLSLGGINPSYSQIQYGLIHSHPSLYEWPANSASPRRQVSQPPTLATATVSFKNQRYLNGVDGIVYSAQYANSFGFRDDTEIYHCSPGNVITRLDQTPLEGRLSGRSTYFLSRDHSRVIFSRAGHLSSQYDIYSSTIVGAQVRRLTPETTYNRNITDYGPLGDGNSAWLVGNFQTSGRYDIFISRPAVIVPVFPEIAIEDSGVDLPNGESKSFGNVVPGTVEEITFSLLNTGDGELTLTGNPKVDITGSAEFTVTSQPTSPVAPDGFTTFTVRIAPTTPGIRTASFNILSDDADESLFTIQLTGTSFSYTTDTDGDGMSDAAEFNMTALGFDWTVAQPDLVNTYFQNAEGAGLYTASQIQAMKSGTPLIARNPATGKFKLTMNWKKSTDLNSFLDFPAPLGSSVSLNPAGDVEFEFPGPDNAAFFRLEME